MYEELKILYSTAIIHYPVGFSLLKLGSLTLNRICCHHIQCVIALFFLVLDVSITFVSIFSGTVRCGECVYPA